MAKPQDNVVIPDPDTDEVRTESDAQPVVQNFKEDFEMFPVPTGKPGLGSKWCPHCNAKQGARAEHCKNCGYAFPTKSGKAPKRVEGGRTITTSPRKTEEAPKVNKLAAWQVIKGRGYDLSVSLDILDPKAEPTIKCDKEIQPLIDLLQSKGVELIQSSPSIKYSISLDDLFTLLKIKPRK